MILADFERSMVSSHQLAPRASPLPEQSLTFFWDTASDLSLAPPLYLS